MANQYYIPSMSARGVSFRSDKFPDDVSNVYLALEILQKELEQIIVGGGANIDDTTISTLSTWSSQKMVDSFVRTQPGFGLSEHNFSQIYKDRLDNLANYAQDIAWLRGQAHTHNNKPLLDGIKQSDIDAWNNKSNFSGRYDDLIGLPNLDNLANYATKTDIQNLALRIPTKVSQLTNDGVYVTEALLEQENLDRDFVQKAWVLQKINELSTMKMQKVNQLPTTADYPDGRIPTNIIFLVPNPAALPEEQYFKWINLDGGDGQNSWERIGTTTDGNIDKDNYYTKTEVDRFLFSDKIALRNLDAQFPGLTNVSQALATLRTDVDAIDTTQYVPRPEFGTVAFSNDYMDLDNKPVLKLTGTPANPIVLSELTTDVTYILDGVCKVLRNSAETPTVLAFGTTIAHSFTNGNQTELYVATNQMVNGAVRPCMVHATYNTNLTGNPTIETNYLITSEMVITKGDTRPYIPTGLYDPVNVKYLQDYLDGKGFNGFLKIKGNAAFTPTDPTDAVNKSYVDTQIELRKPKRTSELVNDVPFLVERDIADFMTEQEILTAINNSNKLEKRIVETLPADADADDNVIYLLGIKNPDGTVGHYETYQKINGKLLLTGSTDTDLSDYYNKATIDKKIEEATIPVWDVQDTYKVGKIVLKDNVFYRAIANPPTPGQFIDAEWDKVGTSEDDVNELIKKQLFFPDAQNPTIVDENDPIYVPEAEVLTYEKADIEGFLNYTPDQLANMEKFIDDNQVVTDKVWSSAKTNERDNAILDESKGYTDDELKNYIKTGIVHVDDKADIKDEKYLYYFKNKLDPNDKGFYIIKDGVLLSLELDLTAYYTRAQIDAKIDDTVKISEMEHDFTPIEHWETDADEDKTYSQKGIQSLYSQLASDLIPVGTILPYAGDTAPDGFLMCDGSEIRKQTYVDLFRVIGETYGTGTTEAFCRLPNLRGKVIVGRDGNDADFNTVGKTGGEKTHIITVDEMPTHTHTLTIDAHSHLSSNNGTHSHTARYRYNSGWWYLSGSGSAIDQIVTGGDVAGGSGTASTKWYSEGVVLGNSGSHNHTISSVVTTGRNANTGGSQEMSLMNPYMVMNYIIKY